MTDIFYLQKTGLPGFGTGTAVPVGFRAPGGKSLPEMQKEPDEGAPVISGVTDLTYPDETLTISGENLTGASLILWTEGQLRAVEPLRADNTKLQAVVPPDLEKSMILVWPQNDSGIGRPLKVNAPAVWWTDRGTLLAGQPRQEIRFFGKSLSIDGRAPVVVGEYGNGERELLDVRDANPYEIRAELRTNLPAGISCTFYVHNGTGGEYGWSAPITLETAENPVFPEEALPVVRVENYGAVADDGLDDSDAIRRAIDAAAQLGGAVLQFGQGEYNVSQTIEIPDCFPKGLYIRGVGTGEYDFGSTLLPGEYEHRGLDGTFTAVRFLDPAHVPENTIRIQGDHIVLKDLTVYGAEGHVDGYSMAYGHTVASYGSHILFDHVRMIKADLRDFNTNPAARLMCSNHIFVAGGSQDIQILRCEFHTKACAIWINHYEGEDQSVLFDDSTQVRHVRIADCDFYGYTSPYTHPDGRKPIADEGEVSRGITAMNCDSVIVEHCRFQGFDQAHCRVLTRTMYIPISANHMYIANNWMHNVGSTPETGFDGNTGEQILFHGGMHLGGIYNVLHNEGTALTVRTDNIQVKDENGCYIRPDTTITNAGSRIQEGLKKGKRGMAYICAGKGVGQIRQIDGYEIREGEVVFHLAEPWITEPDETSIVIETAPFRENIVFRNTIMKDKPTLAQGYKSGGVLMFFDSYSNIIAENDIRNLAFGVALNTAFKAPLLWNTVRDNAFSGIQEAYKDAMQGGDSTRNSTFFCESVVGNAGENAGWDTYNIWYTVGNVFRNNRCCNGDTAAELATNRWHRLHNSGLEDYHGEEKGNALTVLENNTFKEVADGVLVGNPAYWSLIRNNVFVMKDKAGYAAKAVHNEHPMTNFKLLCIENNQVTEDANHTLDPELIISENVSK